MATTVNLTGALQNRTVNSPALDRFVSRIDAKFGHLDPVVNVNHVEWFGKRPGFVIVNAVIEKDGVRLPGSAVLRGDGVAILLVMKHNGRKYTALVNQDRIPVGQSNYVEIPAGTLDKPGLGFNEIAALELQEEVDANLPVDEANFIELGRYHTSPGGLDEEISLVAMEIDVTQEYLDGLHGAITGADEGEVIRVQIIDLYDLPAHTNDMKSVLAYHLYLNMVK